MLEDEWHCVQARDFYGSGFFVGRVFRRDLLCQYNVRLLYDDEVLARVFVVLCIFVLLEFLFVVCSHIQVSWIYF